MKTFSVVLLLIHHFLWAQNPVYHTDSTIKPISLPDIKGARLHFSYKSNPIYIGNQKDYYTLFDEKQHQNLPFIDFEKEYLRGMYYCIYCHKTKSVTGLHLEDSVWYDYEPRHRNACGYALFWQTISKKRQTIVPFWLLSFTQTQKSGEKSWTVIDSQEDYQALRIKKPEIASTLTGVDFSKYTVLTHIIESDCAARFEYNISHDVPNKKYILQIYHISRGCTTTQTNEYWIKVPKAPVGYTYQEKIIPVKTR